VLWATRPDCHVDRTACAWAIRRFIDPKARFVFVVDIESARAEGATPFDMRGAELGHHDGRCSFESLLLKYDLGDPALRELADVVHEADVDDDRFHTPEAAGLDAVIRGLQLVVADDQRLLALTDQVYDGLYAWFRRTVI
jgi:hypothetical protein